MPTKARRFSPEVRERAVRLVRDHQEDYELQWGAITSIARKIGCTAETLRLWVRQTERDAGQRPGVTTEEQQRLKVLEREVRELRGANEILRKAAAYFAQAVRRPDHGVLRFLAMAALTQPARSCLLHPRDNETLHQPGTITHRIFRAITLATGRRFPHIELTARR